jgi:hypothetical protein
LVFLYDFRDVEGGLPGCFYVLSLCLGSKQAIFLATGHTAPYPCLKPLHRKLIFGPAQNSDGWTTGAEDLKRDELTFFIAGPRSVQTLYTRSG